MPRGEGARLLPPWCAPQLPTRCAGLGVTSRAAGDSDGGQCSRTATPASSRWGKDHRRLPRARGGPRGGVRGHCDGDVCGPVRGPAASVIPVGRHRPCHRLLRAERICLHDSLGHTLRLATCGHRLRGQHTGSFSVIIPVRSPHLLSSRGSECSGRLTARQGHGARQAGPRPGAGSLSGWWLPHEGLRKAHGKPLPKSRFFILIIITALVS